LIIALKLILCGVLNKYLQFLLATFSIALVFILGLSTVNKTIHDGLFHPNFLTESSPTPSGCTSHHDGGCQTGESNNDTENCDSLSCPVTIFSNGVLALAYAPEVTLTSYVENEIISELFISYTSEKKKKSHLVRGPPAKKQVQSNHLA
jgi:hypothetical protein